MDSLSIVIPVYRSAEGLNILIEELEAVLPGLAEQYEIILVDDGSPDQSWDVIETLTKNHPQVRGFTLMRNYGQHNALLCGILRGAVRDYCHDGRRFATPADRDLQAARQTQRRLRCRLRKPQHEQHGLLRDLASQITKWVLQDSMGVDVARNVSAFRAFRTQLRDAFAIYSSTYVSIDVLLTWGTTRFAAVTVEHNPRRYGTSNYTLRKLIRHALNMITGFSVLPLQLASYSVLGWRCSAAVS